MFSASCDVLVKQFPVGQTHFCCNADIYDFILVSFSLEISSAGFGFSFLKSPVRNTVKSQPVVEMRNVSRDFLNVCVGKGSF